MHLRCWQTQRPPRTRSLLRHSWLRRLQAVNGEAAPSPQVATVEPFAAATWRPRLPRCHSRPSPGSPRSFAVAMVLRSARPRARAPRARSSFGPPGHSAHEGATRPNRRWRSSAAERQPGHRVTRRGPTTLPTGTPGAWQKRRVGEADSNLFVPPYSAWSTPTPVESATPARAGSMRSLSRRWPSGHQGVLQARPNDLLRAL